MTPLHPRPSAEPIGACLLKLARCSKHHQIILAGPKSPQLMQQLRRRGCERVATTATCGPPGWPVSRRTRCLARPIDRRPRSDAKLACPFRERVRGLGGLDCYRRILAAKIGFDAAEARFSQRGQHVLRARHCHFGAPAERRNFVCCRMTAL
jgi:hypothetical protein